MPGENVIDSIRVSEFVAEVQRELFLPLALDGIQHVGDARGSEQLTKHPSCARLDPKSQSQRVLCGLERLQ